jgi:hypothetical protein
MNLTILYRASMYAMLVLATLVLSVDAADYNRFAMLYPVGVAVAGFGALWTVDRDPSLGLSRDLANFLAMGSFVLAAMEYWSNPTAVVLASGHVLVYLQLVMMFLPKRVGDDWFLFLLGLVQVIIGTYLSQSGLMGTLLIAWALTALWTLGLFHLYREAPRLAAPAGARITPEPDPTRPFPGLVNPGFVGASLLLAVSTVALSSLVFLLIPRWNADDRTPSAPAAPRHLTGFSDQIKLGQMGEILENDARVMIVQVLDSAGQSVRLPEETLWRGVTLTRYEAGHWVRTEPEDVPIDRISFRPVPSGTLRLRVKLEPSDSDILFATRPIYGVSAQRRGELAFNRSDGTLLRREAELDLTGEARPSRPKVYDYEIVTVPGDDRAIQPEEFPMGEARRDQWLEIPESIREALGEVAAGVLGEQRGRSAEVRARALERYLRDDGGFFYSLRMEESPSGDDPVVDFLTRRKEGHCEYFASALTLLLRTQGIPARMVNGFKGGDWDDLFRVMTVREKHAHSWVEAFIGQSEFGRPVWLVLDPTPGRQREQVVARVGSMPVQFRSVSDAIHHAWLFYVVGLNQELQQQRIYGPIRAFLALASQGLALINQILGRALARLFAITFGDFFSVRGFFVSVGLMLAAVTIFRLVGILLARIVRRLRGAGRAVVGASGGHAYFARLVRMLSAQGLERAPAETPREFARRAGAFLAARPGPPDGVAEVPDQVVEAFYRARFGHRTLSPEDLRQIDERLEALDVRLRLS